MIGVPEFTEQEAREWAAAQRPPFRIVFRSKRARRLTFGRMPTITLGHTVYTEGDTIRRESLYHEFMHVLQWSWTFPVRYLWELFLHNYTGNKYEEEARVYAKARMRAERLA